MNGSSNTNWPVIGGIVVVTVLLFAGLVWLLTSVPSSTTPGGNGTNVTFNESDAPRKGPADAKVTVHIYGDLQCPACKSAEVPLQLAEQKYQDRVAFVWNDFPLMSLHPNARNAANAARCAEAQGKFWEYHDMLYDQQSSWADERNPVEKFVGYAGALGMDGDAFRSCYEAKTFDAAKVMRDVAEGTKNGVDRTPTFFINNKRLFGMSPDQWYSELDAALAEVSSTQAPAPAATTTAATSTVPTTSTATP